MVWGSWRWDSLLLKFCVTVGHDLQFKQLWILYVSPSFIILRSNVAFPPFGSEGWSLLVSLVIGEPLRRFRRQQRIKRSWKMRSLSAWKPWNFRLKNWRGFFRLFEEHVSSLFHLGVCLNPVTGGKLIITFFTYYSICRGPLVTFMIHSTPVSPIMRNPTVNDCLDPDVRHKFVACCLGGPWLRGKLWENILLVDFVSLRIKLTYSNKQASTVKPTHVITCGYTYMYISTSAPLRLQRLGTTTECHRRGL